MVGTDTDRRPTMNPAPAMDALRTAARHALEQAVLTDDPVEREAAARAISAAAGDLQRAARRIRRAAINEILDGGGVSIRQAATITGLSRTQIDQLRR